jgi:DNA-binding HxlR family transcriptional regulator
MEVVGNVSMWDSQGPDDCPVANTIEILSGKWKPRLLHTLLSREMHFLELVRALPSASRKVIADQLRELQAAGLVSRTATEDARRRVRYGLTLRGRSLCAVLAPISLWAKAG